MQTNHSMAPFLEQCCFRHTSLLPSYAHAAIDSDTNLEMPSFLILAVRSTSGGGRRRRLGQRYLLGRPQWLWRGYRGRAIRWCLRSGRGPECAAGGRRNRDGQWTPALWWLWHYSWEVRSGAARACVQPQLNNYIVGTIRLFNPRHSKGPWEESNKRIFKIIFSDSTGSTKPPNTHYAYVICNSHIISHFISFLMNILAFWGFYVSFYLFISTIFTLFK